MIGWLRTLRGRTIAVVAAGTLISHLVGLALYFTYQADSLTQAREQQVVDRVASLTWLLESVPSGSRGEVLARFSEPGFEFVVSGRSAVAELDEDELDTRELRQRLATTLGATGGAQVLADYLNPARQTESDPEAWSETDRTILAERVAQWFRFRENLLVSVQLDDGSWLNARMRGRPLALFFNPGLILSLGLMIVVVFSITAWAIARPLAGLQQFARAAEALGNDVENAPPLDEAGPVEIRRTARAFNRMRDRVQSLVEDRTRMLAAMSHDFRTPLTRLRLRAEYLSDDGQKGKMLRDVADMEQMIASTLRYIRDGVADEPREAVDFVSMLTDLCLDMGLEPPEFRLQGARGLRIACAPVAMRRAFTNLLENAVVYAGGAEIRVECRNDRVMVEVVDHGPGIPQAEYENVFRAYYRLEPSRSRQTGGTGLGLAIARSIIRAHGGDIALHPAPGGGLLVRVDLPPG